MQRSKYFNYTRPTETQLGWTEQSRSGAMLRRSRSTAQMGVASGFRVSINSLDATKLDIGPGEGYSGGTYLQNNYEGENSGERISTYTDGASGVIVLPYVIQGQALADYTLGAVNYISLVFLENESDPLASKYYPFTTHDTIVMESFSVSVMTSADWTALSAAEINERVLVAIVTANGAGVPLTLANVDQVVQPKSHPSPAQPVNITGALMYTIAPTTLIGSGTLRFEAATRKLYWTAPGDTEGAGVSVTDSGDYTLYSSTVAYWAIVQVVFGALPVTDQTDTIQISSLYGRTIPLFSAVDTAHRDMIGSGQPTVTNVHGITLDDIPGGTLDLGDHFHVNGISNDSDITMLQPSIFGPSIHVTNPGGQRSRYLVDGHIKELLTGLAAGTDGTIAFAWPLAAGDFLIYVDSAGQVQRVCLNSNALWTANIDIVDMRNTTPGNGTLAWDAATGGLSWLAPGDVGPAVEYTKYCGLGYYKIYSFSGGIINFDNWIIVEVTGALGATNSSVIATTMDSTNHPEDNILRLGIVRWSGAALSNLRDIRSWRTADNRWLLDAEHDRITGWHTKPLQNTLKIGIVGGASALYGIADNQAVIGSAILGATGIYGYALSRGVVGIASANTAGYFSAGADIGVYGLAQNTAVYGVAAVKHAGVFLAPTTAVSVTVANDTAMFVSADNFAVHATVNVNTAIYGTADGIVGVCGAAPSIAVYGTAAVNSAVYGSADIGYGVVGKAGNATGVFGYAPTSGVVGSAVNQGVYGQADVDYGVRGQAANGIGVYGYAPLYGVWGSANNTGVWGKAAVNYGVMGSAIGNYGVWGQADAAGATAVVGYAAHVVNGTGVCGTAESVGVYGTAATIGVRGLVLCNNAAVYGMGVSGSAGNGADAAKAIGVYGTAGGAGAYGVFGEAAGVGGIGGVFSGAGLGIKITNRISYAQALVPVGVAETGVEIIVMGATYTLQLNT